MPNHDILVLYRKLMTVRPGFPCGLCRKKNGMFKVEFKADFGTE